MVQNIVHYTNISNKFRHAKQEWRKEKGAEIETMRIIDKENMHKTIRKITGQKCIISNREG